MRHLSIDSLRTALFQELRHEAAKNHWCKGKPCFCRCQIRLLLVRWTLLQNKSPFPFSYEACTLLNYKNWILPLVGTWLMILNFWVVLWNRMCISMGNLNEHFKESRWHKLYQPRDCMKPPESHLICWIKHSIQNARVKLWWKQGLHNGNSSLSILVTPAHEMFSDGGAGHF